MRVAKHRTPKKESWLTAPRSWALWQTPARVWALVVAVDTAAAVLGVTALVRSTITAGDLLRFGLLAAMSVAYLEASRQLEVRRRLFVPADSSHFDMSSVWILAGALVLPPGLAVLIAVSAYVHLWIRSWRSLDGVRAYRVAYNGATMVLTCLVVSAAADASGMSGAKGPELFLAIVVGALTYRVVNRVLVLLAIAVSVGVRRLATVTGTLTDNTIEFATLALGAATAVLVLKIPPLAVLVLPAVFLLQHRALLMQLVQAATVDPKTALLNAAAWRQLAQRELERAARQGTPTAVLVIDMDYFKQLNDTYGHLAGDDALRAVARALSEELRGYDAVGRFGGEEFVALLPAVDAMTAANVAERIRGRIERLDVTVKRHAGAVTHIGVTASIGVAGAWGAADLDDLLRDADAALYRAKGGGRNTVRQASAVRAVA
jgi:diguanylate cyclase (GGDEF)-like protein